VVDAILQQGVPALGAAAGSLYELTDARGQRELALVAHTGYPPGSHDRYTYLPLEDGVGVAEAVRTRSPVFLDSALQMQERWPDSASLHASMGFSAVAALPLVARGRTLGALAISFRDAHHFDSEERDLIMTVVHQSALALDRAQLYESEHRARADAESAVRARDEFLSIASHELRNPLATLKGRLDLLLRQARRGRLDPDQLPHQLETASAAAARLGRLIDDLLDVSRLRTGQMPLVPSDVDLVRLLREATDRIATTGGPNHDVRLEVACQSCVVRGDPDRLEQVVANLLENAFKYSPQGGTVRVELVASERGVLVRVTDQGIGLPAGAEELIFEPFGRAPNASARNIPGMGLGLYVSRQIAAAHDGRLWAESRGEGHGTTFSLWLPVRE
jgi:signal transduction histidine kinase